MVISYSFKVMGKERIEVQKKRKMKERKERKKEKEINTWSIKASVMSSGEDLNQAHWKMSWFYPAFTSKHSLMLVLSSCYKHML